MASKFKSIKIFQLVDKLLEGKVSILLLKRAQVVTKPLIQEYLAKLQEKLVTKAIVIFDKNHLEATNINPSSEMSFAIEVVFYLML